MKLTIGKIIKATRERDSHASKFHIQLRIIKRAREGNHGLPRVNPKNLSKFLNKSEIKK